MSDDGLGVLLSEIERQLDATTLETSPLEDDSPPAKLIIGRQDEYHAYRHVLLSLRSELLDSSIRALSHDTRSPQSGPETKDCFWKLPAFCAGQLCSTFILPELLKRQCMAAVRVQGEGRLRSKEAVDIWKDANLKSWSTAKGCCLIVAQGSSQSSDRLRHLSCDVIDRFNDKCPTIYILNSSTARGHFTGSGPLDILRQIAIQGLRKVAHDISIHFLADMVRRFQSAEKDTDWLSILESIFQVANNMCVVVDLSILGAQSKLAQGWVASLCSILSRMERESPASVKVMFLTNRQLMKDLNDQSQSSILCQSTPTGLPSKLASNSDVALEDRIVLASYAVHKERHESNSNRDKSDQPPSTIPLQQPMITHSTVRTSAAKATDGNAEHHPRDKSGLHAKDRRHEVEIAIICALSREADAIETLCDKFFDLDQFPRPPGDSSMYSVALLGGHKVVLVYMPAMGKSTAASVVAACRTSFPRIRLAILSGICGGAPFSTKNAEILLGDVIISDGLVLYDFGRQNPDGFQRKNTLLENARKMPPNISAFMAKLKTRMGQERMRHRTSRHLDTLRQEPELGQWATYPGTDSDVLFESAYIHRHHDRAQCEECAVGEAHQRSHACDTARQARCAELACDNQRSVHRKRLEAISRLIENGEAVHPAIHFGVYASGDKVMKSGEDRDQVNRVEGVIAFEMEGAGIWDQCPCIIVKGVCDYADSHKNKDWQNYAATTAAACVKAMLEEWPIHVDY